MGESKVKVIIKIYIIEERAQCITEPELHSKQAQQCIDFMQCRGMCGSQIIGRQRVKADRLEKVNYQVHMGNGMNIAQISQQEQYKRKIQQKTK